MLTLNFELQILNSHAQIVINEVCSANNALIADEDGAYEDWMELYNPTDSVISLNNYSLVYEEPGEATVVWTFPNTSIDPKSHMLIFTSEKDRKDIINHWEVPIFPDSIWKYVVNTVTPPDTDWYQPAYNDLSWQQGQGGFGYGDGDDNTDVGAALSVFVRTTFIIPDTSIYPLGFLMIDYDDAFVAYLNGVEIARANIGAYGDHPAYDAFAYEDHEAQLYQNGNPDYYLIPKTVLNAALQPGSNVLAIQVHNISSVSSDLSLLPYLILGSKSPTQAFPSFPADYFMHTNFSLSNTDGFKLSLKNSSGGTIDSLTLGTKNMQVNNSRGRNPDGANNWCLFMFPTPKDTNDVSPCFGTYVQDPAFSLPAGFYNGTQTVSLTVPAGTMVFYTRNGNTPTWTDALYSTPLTIDSTQVIRARAFSISGTDLPGNTITHTYFINENISLPVISLCTDSLNLWDDTTGIYVMGPNADTIIPYQNANFWMNWKRQSHTEYFTKTDLLGFEQEAAVSIHGNFSRAWPQKSFRISANDDYGDSRINYQLFPDKNINKFRSFNIRNAGIDWNTCHFRDRLMHKIVQKKTDIDIMDGEAVVLFLNGQYWGVYESRERQDEYYLSENHNVSAENVDLLRFEGDILKGTNSAFYEMVQFIGSNDMTIQANYDSALALIDLENYCDYFIAETYYNNADWIWIDEVNKSEATNNIKFWRTISPPGKWRYILWDTDLGMSLFDGTSTNCPQNLFGNIIDSSILFPSYHVVVLKSLLKNNSFRNYFINRYCDLMNTIFYPDNVIEKVHQFRDEMLPEMARHFTKWNGPILIFGAWTVGRATDVPSWLNEIDTLEEFVNCRPYSVRDSLEQEFSLVKQVDVTMDVSPAGAGKIKLNTILLDSFSWTGVYFDGAPVTMTAIANPGYKFLHWKSPTLIAVEDTNDTVIINVSQNETFTAYFEAINTYVNPVSRQSVNVSVHPNPFSRQTEIKYSLATDAQIKIELYNVLGQKVKTIADEKQISGEHKYSLNFEKESSEIYFLKMKIDNEILVKKIIHLK